MDKKPTHAERIANGECVSEQGTERCPVCNDRCEAFFHKTQLAELKKESGIEPTEFK